MEISLKALQQLSNNQAETNSSSVPVWNPRPPLSGSHPALPITQRFSVISHFWLREFLFCESLNHCHDISEKGGDNRADRCQILTLFSLLRLGELSLRRPSLPLAGPKTRVETMASAFGVSPTVGYQYQINHYSF